MKNCQNRIITKDPAGQIKIETLKNNQTMTIRVEQGYYFQSALRSKRVKIGDNLSSKTNKPASELDFKTSESDHNQHKKELVGQELNMSQVATKNIKNL